MPVMTTSQRLLQISNINSGTGATNVIPETLEVIFNFRFSTETTEEELKAKTHAIFDKHFANTKASYDIYWKLSGQPFLTPEGKLVSACQRAIKNVTDIDTTLSTSGGTSDGRFIAPTGAQVVELGVRNATIHQVDEKVEVDDLGKLAQIYDLREFIAGLIISDKSKKAPNLYRWRFFVSAILSLLKR